MWPWGHALLGYLLYSLFSHVRYRDPPGEREALLVAFGALLPDLIDKPLAWEFGVFETGYALGHSILFAGPLAVAAGLFGRAVGDGRAGLAFGVGLLLHLAGDVLPGYARTGELTVDHLLWPVAVVGNPGPPPGLVGGTWRNLSPYLDRLLALDLTPYLLAQLGLAAAAVALWIYDGTPGPRALYAGARRTYATVRRLATTG